MSSQRVLRRRKMSAREGVRLIGIRRTALMPTLVGPEASLHAGPGPAVRLQLVHPDEPRRFMTVDLVWDRVQLNPADPFPRDELLFRGWLSHPSLLVRGELFDSGGAAAPIGPDPRAAQIWSMIDGEAALQEQAPPFSEGPHQAVWIPFPLAGSVREWVNALRFRAVSSEIAVALETLLDGFFGEGGAHAVARGITQLRQAISSRGFLH